MKDARDLVATISAMSPGTEVKLSLQRKSEEKILSMTLGQQPEQRRANNSNNQQAVGGDGTPRVGDATG